MADNIRNVTIAGAALQIKDTYSEGHTINAAEAATLNQTRAENIGNNIRKRLTDLRGDKDDYSPEDLEKAQAILDEVAADYEFSLTPRRGGGTAGMTPLQKEMARIANDYLVGKIKEKGLTKKAWIEANGQDKFDENMAKLLENPAIREAAEEELKVRAKAEEKKAKILAGVAG